MGRRCHEQLIIGRPIGPLRRRKPRWLLAAAAAAGIIEVPSPKFERVGQRLVSDARLMKKTNKPPLVYK